MGGNHKIEQLGPILTTYSICEAVMRMASVKFADEKKMKNTYIPTSIWVQFGKESCRTEQGPTAATKT